MSVEQELKLHIPESARADVKALAELNDHQTIHLHAFYFDTSERELAKVGIALRLRKEEGKWIQTIKLPGSDSLTKIEYNHERPAAELDLQLYQGTPAEEAFAKLQHPLTERFETDITRTLRLIETPQGSVELAYDEGFIRAGNLSLPVHELELELKEGSPAAIFYLTAIWQSQYSYLLDFRSKAERGDRLADAALNDTGLDANFKLWQPWQGLTDTPATTDPKQAILEALEQVARNAAVIAAIDRLDLEESLTLNTTEHFEQVLAALAYIDAHCSESDSNSAILYKLQTHAQNLSTLSAEEPEVIELLQSRDFQGDLLSLLGWCIL